MAAGRPCEVLSVGERRASSCDRLSTSTHNRPQGAPISTERNYWAVLAARQTRAYIRYGTYVGDILTDLHLELQYCLGFGGCVWIEDSSQPERKIWSWVPQTGLFTWNGYLMCVFFLQVYFKETQAVEFPILPYTRKTVTFCSDTILCHSSFFEIKLQVPKNYGKSTDLHYIREAFAPEKTRQDWKHCSMDVAIVGGHKQHQFRGTRGYESLMSLIL